MAFSAMISDISCLFSLALEFSTRFRGASPKLHAVRDFYSHSDWIHNDFNKNDVKMAKLVFAFDTVSVLFISWTTTSCEEPASRLTSSIASLQIAQPANHLYRNNRDGTFTDVTAKANLVRSGWGQGVCVGDYNNDGLMDLFVTYYGKNVLYRNNGDGTFTDVTHETGLLQLEDHWNSGAAFLDYDRDGHLDLFVSNYVAYESGLALYESDPALVGVQSPVLHGPAGLQGSKNILYHNNGDRTFTDVTKSAGISKPEP